MKNELASWKKLAARNIPMIAPFLYAATYIEEPDKSKWPPETGEGTFMVCPDTLTVTYQPEFTKKHTVEQNAWFLAHEGVHFICEHAKRINELKAREGSKFIPELAIYAQEVAVNTMVESLTGQATPEVGIKPIAAYKNLSFEEIYQELRKTAKIVRVEGFGCSCHKPGAKGTGTENSAGELLRTQVIDAATREAQEHIKERGIQAGDMPGELRQLSVGRMKLNKPPDFRELLKRYLLAMEFNAKEFDMAAIYRRRMDLDGMCPPNLSSRPAGRKFVLSIDNSGSVSDEMFSCLKGIMHEVAQQLGFQEIIVQHFTSVVVHTEILRTMQQLGKVKRQAKGGTQLEDCDRKAAGYKPQFHVILTDGAVQWLPQYRVPTVIVRTVAETEAPSRGRNMAGDVVVIP